MVRRLGMCLCLVAIAGFVALPAFAAVQNVKVSGDIKVMGVSRDNFDLKDSRGGSAQSTNKDGVNAGVSQARVKIDADLSDNVSTTVRLLNERMWGREATTTTANDTVDTTVAIDLANITLKEFLYSPLTLTVGRQELHYGAGLIVGDPDSNLTAAVEALGGALGTSNVRDLSLRKSFDAIKAVLDYNPLVVDLIYAKIDENNARLNDDVTLLGSNLRYDLGKKNTILEAYYFGKITGSAAASQFTSGTFLNREAKTEKIHTVGGRVSTVPIENLNLQAEAAYQFGEYDPSLDVNAVDGTTTTGSGTTQKGHRSAWAAQVIADYRVKAKYDPRLVATYTYLSGEDNNRTTGKYNGWASAFEDQTVGDIANAIFAPSNSHIISITGQAKPMADLTVDVTYAYFRLAEEFKSHGNYDAAQGPELPKSILSGVSILNTSYYMVPGKYDLGNEVDLHVAYDYTEDVQLGLSGGIFIPGNAFAKAYNRDNATQAIASVKVTF